MPGWTIDWSKWDHLLGTMTDAALSRRIGCAYSSVVARRDKLGISPINERVIARKPPMKREKIDWSKWDHLLGTMTDRALSKQVECSPQAVTLRRNKLGIPSVRTARLESGNLRERRNATAQYNSKAAIGQANPEVVAELAELAGKMYSIKDIAGYLGATVRTVQGYLKNGKLKGVKIGGGWKVSAENFQKFMRGE